MNTPPNPNTPPKRDEDTTPLMTCFHKYLNAIEEKHKRQITEREYYQLMQVFFMGAKAMQHVMTLANNHIEMLALFTVTGLELAQMESELDARNAKKMAERN